MPSTSENAAFVRSEYRSVSIGPVSSVVTAFGPLARRTEAPVPTRFQSKDDAEAILAARMAIFGPDVRKTDMAVSGEATGLSFLASNTGKTVSRIDAKLALNRPGKIVEYYIDTAKSETKMAMWG